MKKLLFIALAIMAIACTKEEENPQIKDEPSTKDEAPYLSFEEGQNSTITLSPDGATETISFTTNNPWTASSSEAWLSVSPISGNAGTHNIKLTASANPDDGLKKAIVTIQSQNLSQSFNVTQEEIEFTVDDTRFWIDYNGGTVEIPIMSNVEYSTEILDNAEWLTITQTKAAEESFIEVNVAENKDFKFRKC